MPDAHPSGNHSRWYASLSVHPPPFDYDDPVYVAAATAAKARSDGHCQLCGRKLPLEAHHWAKFYPPADQTTAADLTGLCRDCHIKQELACLFENAGGGPPAVLCAAWSETVAILLHRGAARMPRSPMRVGRVVRSAGRWIALVTGESRPCIDEVFRLFLISRGEWRTVVVTEVLDGQPGCWRVRKRFLNAAADVRPMCIDAADGASSRCVKPDGPRSLPATFRNGGHRVGAVGVGVCSASGQRQVEGRRVCA